VAHFDYNSIVFQYKSCKIVILQYKWNYINSKSICVISLFISPVLDLIWRSDMTVQDRQQSSSLADQGERIMFQFFFETKKTTARDRTLDAMGRGHGD
jgi:hypothetical protein